MNASNGVTSILFGLLLLFRLPQMSSSDPSRCLLSLCRVIGPADSYSSSGFFCLLIRVDLQSGEMVQEEPVSSKSGLQISHTM